MHKLPGSVAQIAYVFLSCSCDQHIKDYGFYSCLTNCTVHNMANTASIEGTITYSAVTLNFLPYSGIETILGQLCETHQAS